MGFHRYEELNHGVDNVFFATDSKVAMGYLKGTSEPPWNAMYLVQRINILMDQFQFF